MLNRLEGKQRYIFTAGVMILAIQAVLANVSATTEFVPSPPPLSSLPDNAGNWTRSYDIYIDSNVSEMLGADELLSRAYRTDDGRQLNLFMAYYKTQHRAKNAHSPKVCLPGSGWIPVSSQQSRFGVPDGTVIEANEFVVAKRTSKAAVLYWYQTPRGAVAGEQKLNVTRFFETLTDHRSDMALIRIVLPFSGNDSEAAFRTARGFASSLYSDVTRFFPATVVRSRH